MILIQCYYLVSGKLLVYEIALHNNFFRIRKTFLQTLFLLDLINFRCCYFESRITNDCSEELLNTTEPCCQLIDCNNAWME